MTHDVIVLPVKRAGARDNTSSLFDDASGAPCSAPDSLVHERAGVDAVAMAVALRYLTDRARRRTKLGRPFAALATSPALP